MNHDIEKDNEYKEIYKDIEKTDRYTLLLIDLINKREYAEIILQEMQDYCKDILNKKDLLNLFLKIPMKHFWQQKFFINRFCKTFPLWLDKNDTMTLHLKCLSVQLCCDRQTIREQEK